MRTRREAMAMLAAGVALTRTSRAFGEPVPGAPAIPAPCPGLADIETLDEALLSLLPDSASRAGLPSAANGGPAAARCDDFSPDGAAALALAVGSVRSRLPAGGCDPGVAQVRWLLDRTAATAGQDYGRNDPLAAIHQPYAATAYAGPHLAVPRAMRLWQPLDTPAALDAWVSRLEAWGTAMLGAAQRVRQDAAAGCLPPVATGRAALIQMDAFQSLPLASHPLLIALATRATALDPATVSAAQATAAESLRRHVLPAMAILRDTLATVTRSGRAAPGVWQQPQGEALHAANLGRAGDTDLTPDAAQAYARSEAARINDLLDHKLAARGLRTGSLADRIAAAFAQHPELMASDDDSGHAALVAAAQARLDAGRALAAKLMKDGGADPQPLRLLPLPPAGKEAAGGSFYLPAAIDGSREATLWLDARSSYALPLPGVSPLAYHLGWPGEHLQASTANIASAPRPMLARIAAWSAATEGWGCYAERLAAENGLFAHDPWGDIARLSDELLRAASLVVDVGIHQQRWSYDQAAAAMTDLTGAPQRAAIDRIAAMPGLAASAPLGLRALLALREKARAASGRHFSLAAFHAAVLAPGARPFAQIESAVLV